MLIIWHEPALFGFCKPGLNESGATAGFIDSLSWNVAKMFIHEDFYLFFYIQLDFFMNKTYIENIVVG